MSAIRNTEFVQATALGALDLVQTSSAVGPVQPAQCSRPSAADPVQPTQCRPPWPYSAGTDCVPGVTLR